MSQEYALLRGEVKVGTMVELTRDGVTVSGPHSDCQDDVHVDIPGAGRACTDDGWEFVRAWRVMSDDEVALMSAWSDYRSSYGAKDEDHRLFQMGWAAARFGLPPETVDGQRQACHAGYDAALKPGLFDEVQR
jgi:hypothetical protein